MDRKEARVCVTCHSALTSGEHHCKQKVGYFQPVCDLCVFMYKLNLNRLNITFQVIQKVYKIVIYSTLI